MYSQTPINIELGQHGRDLVILKYQNEWVYFIIDYIHQYINVDYLIIYK